jgi:hypothetical protein
METKQYPGAGLYVISMFVVFFAFLFVILSDNSEWLAKVIVGTLSGIFFAITTYRTIIR